VGAGITLHEALAAYEELKKDGIHVSVIDLYCVKPLDAQGLLTAARKAKNRILTVEDHYFAGGIGEAVCSALINEVRRLTHIRSVWTFSEFVFPHAFFYRVFVWMCCVCVNFLVLEKSENYWNLPRLIAKQSSITLRRLFFIKRDEKHNLFIENNSLL
jgi:hypothetical protein